MDKENFFSLLRSVPKAEIHVHEEAVLSRETIRKVYKKELGQEMTDAQAESLFAYNDFPGFLDSFIKIQSLFKNIDDLDPMFDDFASYLDDNNITWCETFFSPTAHLRKGWDFDTMLDLVEKRLDQIKEKSGREVRLIIDVSRSFGEENAMRNLDCVLKRKSPYIIGIGLGGDEKKGPAKEYRRVFEKAAQNGLHVVAHAGETCDSSSIKDSVDLLKVERIGHGISIVDDKEYMDLLAEQKIPFEICPTSNIFLQKKFSGNMSNHPVRQLYDAGLFITVNTDDPTFFKVSLIDEYWNLHSVLGFSTDEIKILIKNGFKALFVTEKEKEHWCNSVDAEWDKWFSRHPDQK